MREIFNKKLVYLLAFIFVTTSFSSNVISFSINNNKVTNLVTYNELNVFFIDVGQGDSILIQTPENKFVLIDAGPKDSGFIVVDFLKKRAVYTIDIFVATHPHEDHIGGCEDVFKNFQIKNVYHPGYNYDSQTYKNFLNLIESEGCKIYTDDEINPGDYIDIFSSATFRILHINKYASNPNDASIVIRMDYNKVSFLFTGDINGDTNDCVEEEITNNWDVDVDILKVAHHGSKHSSTNKFLAEATPLVSVISCGRYNPYGHPHIETIQRLTVYNSRICRTDLNGDITIVSNGLNWFTYYETPDDPPFAPYISGTTQGQKGVEHMFSAVTNDPNQDSVYYKWDWNDGNSTFWEGPYPSGYEVYRHHTWYEEGAYIIRVKAKDSNGQESEWSTLNVVMPKDKKMTDNFIFKKLQLFYFFFSFFGK